MVRAETGRFLTEDPVDLRGGINPFVFAHDDPINRWDPTGAVECPEGTRAVGIVAEIYQTREGPVEVEWIECRGTGATGRLTFINRASYTGDLPRGLPRRRWADYAGDEAYLHYLRSRPNPRPIRCAVITALTVTSAGIDATIAAAVVATAGGAIGMRIAANQLEKGLAAWAVADLATASRGLFETGGAQMVQRSIPIPALQLAGNAATEETSVGTRSRMRFLSWVRSTWCIVQGRYAATDSGSAAMKRSSVTARVLVCVILSLLVAAVFSVLASLSVLVGRGEALPRLGYSLPSLIGAYFGAAIVAGVLVGLLLPIASAHAIGAALVGAIVGSLVYSGFALPTEPIAAWRAGLRWYVAIGGFAGAIGGLLVRQSMLGFVDKITRKH